MQRRGSFRSSIDSRSRPGKRMKKVAVRSILLVTGLLAVAAVVQAQQPGKVHRIGFLAGVSLSAISARVEAFREGLREFGYAQGKNIVIEYRYAEGKLDGLPALAAELMHLKVDIVVTASPYQPALRRK